MVTSEDGLPDVMSTTPDPDRVAVAERVAARLRQEQAALRAGLMQLTADMTALIEASYGFSAGDEHDPEGQTIAFEARPVPGSTSPSCFRRPTRHVEGGKAAPVV